MFTISTFIKTYCSVIQPRKAILTFSAADGAVVALLFGKQANVRDHVFRTGIDTCSPVDVVVLFLFEGGCLLFLLLLDGGLYPNKFLCSSAAVGLGTCEAVVGLSIGLCTGTC